MRYRWLWMIFGKFWMIHFNGIFHSSATILGFPHSRKPSYVYNSNLDHRFTGWWLVTFCIFHILGTIIPIDYYFSDGLKPQTRKWFWKIAASFPEMISMQWKALTQLTRSDSWPNGAPQKSCRCLCPSKFGRWCNSYGVPSVWIPETSYGI